MPLKTVSGQSYKATIRTFGSSLVHHIAWYIDENVLSSIDGMETHVDPYIRQFLTGESEDEAILMFRTAYDLNVEGMVILENQILTDLYDNKLDIDYSKVAYPNIICPMNMVCISCMSTPLTVYARMDSLLSIDTLNKWWSIEYIKGPHVRIPK